MKINTTKQPLAPLRTIHVGYMKHYFFCAFLSLLLASCGGGGGGGGGSDSGASSKKKVRACKTLIAKGKGGIFWNKATKKYSTTCTVISCDAGYDNDVDSTKCQQTASGFYSLAKDKSRKKCPTPTNSSSTGRSGLSSPNDCWNCNSGYTISGRTCNKAIPKTLALGEDTSRVLFDNGEVEAWGKVNAFPWRTHIKEDLGSHTPQALVSGDYHQCIILENSGQNHGRLMCWGANGDEQLGVGDTNPRSTPIAVTVLGNDVNGDPYTVKSVAAGGNFTCALLNDDTVKCWGSNGWGQIGGGSGGNKTISGTVGGPLGSTTASRISAGWGHTCAVLTTDKSVKCWGSNIWGQTGRGTPSLGAGKTATEIAAGGLFSCAILDDGSVVCWGQIGTPPSLVGKTATKIAPGHRYACGLLNDKTVKCWGYNNNVGQIGGGGPDPNQVLRGTVGDPLSGQTAIQIAVGYQHSCAVMDSDNSVKCWGRNIDISDTGFYGQIIGKVAMTGGSDGTRTSTGETATLTAASAPTATALDSDASGKICKIELSGGTLGTPWVAKNYTTPLTYNAGGITLISDAIDNLITAIGSPVNIAGTNVTLSKSGTDKIAATTDTAVFDGMTLTIYHDDDGGNCTTSPVATEISLSGASGGDKAEGLWVISHDFAGSGDTTVNLDSVHIDLGNTALSKEDIADKIVADVNGASWAGKQNVDLPYMATKLDGASSTTDDCPSGDFCVLFERVFKGTEGNYGIPFGDRDYEH